MGPAVAALSPPLPGKLPLAVCPRRAFDEVRADASQAPWLELAPLGLCENVTGQPAAQATTVRIGWDSRDFRVLFECVDRHVWATLTARDAPLYEEEVVELFLDPVGDGLAYFEIELNPLNAVLDLVLRRNRSGYKKDFAWDCEGLRTAVARTPEGWAAELAIPFASIAAEAPQSGAIWRVNFLRIDRPENLPRELSAWSPTLTSTFHVPERFGAIEFRD